MEHALRGAAFERLDALIGEWTIEAAPPAWETDFEVTYRRVT